MNSNIDPLCRDLLDDKRQVCRQTWPETCNWTLMETAEHFGCSDEAMRFESAYRSLAGLREARVSIIGVIGGLNAGKSSLVASFLSPTGAARIPRGVDASKGTQRFVFWFPEKWRENNAILSGLEAALKSCFGMSPKLLAQDPLTAHLEYNGCGDGGAGFGEPLVAYDPGLCDFALLDCPDFSRAHPSKESNELREHTREIRKDFLRRAAPLISAFALVAVRRKVAAEDFRFCLDENLGVVEKDCFLLINQVRPKDNASELLTDSAITHLMGELRISQLFGAFDHSLEGADERIGKSATNPMKPAEFPVFFRIEDEESRNNAGEIGEDRLFQNVLKTIPSGDLWRQHESAFVERLEKQLNDLFRVLHDATREQRAELMQRREALLNFVFGVLSPDRKLNFPVTPDIASQIADAVEANAPYWAKVPLLAVKAARRVKDGVDATINFILFWRQGKQRAAEVIDKFKGTLAFSGLFLATKSRNLSWMREDIDSVDLEESWQAVVDNSKTLKTRLPEEPLRAFASELWETMPLGRRLIIAATSVITILGALVSVCLIPIDGGQSIFMQASLLELLLSLGLGAAGGGFTGTMIVAAAQLDDALKDHAGKPFYRRFATSALDVFGLPRESGAKWEPKFMDPGVVTIRLEPEPDDPRLEKKIDLAQGRCLIEEIPDVWLKP